MFDTNRMYFEWDQNRGKVEIARENASTFHLKCYTYLYYFKNNQVNDTFLNICELDIDTSHCMVLNVGLNRCNTSSKKTLKQYQMLYNKHEFNRSKEIDSFTETELNEIYDIASHLFMGGINGSEECINKLNGLYNDFPFIEYAGEFAENVMGYRKILIWLSKL
jgi:hypothetical protein